MKTKPKSACPQLDIFGLDISGSSMTICWGKHVSLPQHHRREQVRLVAKGINTYIIIKALYRCEANIRLLSSSEHNLTSTGLSINTTLLAFVFYQWYSVPACCRPSLNPDGELHTTTEAFVSSALNTFFNTGRQAYIRIYLLDNNRMSAVSEERPPEDYRRKGQPKPMLH